YSRDWPLGPASFAAAASDERFVVCIDRCLLGRGDTFEILPFGPRPTAAAFVGGELWIGGLVRQNHAMKHVLARLEDGAWKLAPAPMEEPIVAIAATSPSDAWV